ncbi:DNA polymerase I [Mycobacterium phage Achebe]|uniref:DNA-directed DNA polymerase n=1 Tax=Mycobacterium phage Backyardigan TaxID=2902881 RepID=G1BL16_9CAUD|nr:DNA polymerase [Mycobacterium phage Wile]YP_009635456.1 DNA polymerase [Mycobacterium phage Backyardigan]AOT27551.1 DNA polymerase I [Mycobacterium phage Badger]APD17392.1 DNA polymerase I [Mycobacterium phage Achebe]AZS11656.1 DNA polymerase I [Mycobacterium phage Cici]QAY05374.1 DNA polymerase I [Mycobacterium phage Katalie136]QAY06952.1 DNA polymerase I [Mycobacterium phage Datway]QBP31251.1 DNA polymerase I [Mycobacterium phage Bumblebee11]QCW22693.1 DNA polymerase I [Mycobacterium p
MIEHRHVVADDEVVIHVVDRESDLDGFMDFIRAHQGFLGLDSETTGLDIYNDGFRCRLVQFGTPSEAWVVPVERGGPYAGDVKKALEMVQGFVLHNAAYDLQVFERTLGVPMETMWPKVKDTRILAHLVDPRGRDEGGSGHSLEDLTRRYIDTAVADNVKTLMADLAKANKTTKANVWKKVPFEDEHYQLYSGMDPILAARLIQKLAPLVKVSDELVQNEHRLAEICSYMERTGFLLDVEYTEELSLDLQVKESHYNEVALNYGCEKVNSTDQVADVLEGMGVRIKGRTPSGKRKVDDALLSELVEHPQAGEFATAVIEAKKAGKWRKTWVDGFLKQRDSQNRCHAAINPLRARTARMSITGIPAQTLPAGDSTIRRCFLADEGHRIASVDYQAQELRVLAALSKDSTMIEAFLNDEDLHLMTARAAWPDRDITKDSPERKYAKVVNFGRVYGGGAKTVAEQTGLDMGMAQQVVAGFDKAYPEVQKLSQRLQREAIRNGYITTPFIDGLGGRRLPVDPQRAYSALNYLIQSSSRDVTCRALLRLHDAGFTPYLRLPIHDEILASVPAEQAEWGASRIGELMAEQMGPVLIGTDPEVGGRSWGSLYGASY